FVGVLADRDRRAAVRLGGEHFVGLGLARPLVGFLLALLFLLVQPRFFLLALLREFLFLFALAAFLLFLAGARLFLLLALGLLAGAPLLFLAGALRGRFLGLALRLLFLLAILFLAGGERVEIRHQRIEP